MVQNKLGDPPRATKIADLEIEREKVKLKNANEKTDKRLYRLWLR
jgi:hypothetical protein